LNVATPRILIVEDEAHTRRFLRTMLTHHGYETAEAADGIQALGQISWKEPDLIILDLGLPDLDGIRILSRVREKGAIPIIVISARDTESAKVEALDAGANDYITKPVGASELLARIRATFRSTARPKGSGGAGVVELGDLRIDLEHRMVYLGGPEVHLTPTEYALLAVLANRVGHAVSHARLLEEVWGPGAVNQTEYLRVYMRQLRYKLEPEPSQPRHLLTVSGVGYRLQSGDDPAEPVRRSRGRKK
jgi:two-component system KDP operon response regulator KdpE